MVIYVDDCLGAGSSYARAVHLRNVLLDILSRAGFIINWKQCILDPTLLYTALGFTLDFRTLPATVSPSPNRIASTCEALDTAILQPSLLTPRGLCSIGGKIGSLRYALGSSAILHLRYSYRHVASHVTGKKGWDISFPHVPLEILGLEELYYWRHRTVLPITMLSPDPSGQPNSPSPWDKYSWTLPT